MIKTKTLSNCPACDSTNFESSYKVSYATHPSPHLEHIPEMIFRYMRCLQCGLIFLNPMVDEEASEEAHFSNGNPFVWQESYYDFAHAHADSYMPVAKYIHEILVQRNLEKGRILDIGCGSGELLNALRQLGHTDIEGLEPGPQGKRASEESNLNIANTSLNKFYPDAPFDCITMMDVIEHLPNPHQALGNIKRLLKKDGLLILNTPNAHSYLASIRGSKWSAINPPAHVHLWNRKAMDCLMERNGFSPILHETFGHGLLIGIFNKLSRLLPPLKRIVYAVQKHDASLQPAQGGDALFCVYKLQ